jgi:hypothetical protein
MFIKKIDNIYKIKIELSHIIINNKTIFKIIKKTKDFEKIFNIL